MGNMICETFTENLGYLLSCMNREWNAKTPDAIFLCWLMYMIVVNPNDGSYLHKNVIGFFFHISEIHVSASNIENNVFSEIFYFLMAITNSDHKASIFKQDAFINR